jgi:hypothetical protein
MAVWALAGCMPDGSAPGSDRSSSTEPGEPAVTTTATPADPDRVALDRAVVLTTALLAEFGDGAPGLDPGGRFAALHTAHLAALTAAAGPSASASPSLAVPAPRPTRARLRRREAAAQRELARLAEAAESGALARLFASMSAGIAARLAVAETIAR